MTETLCLIKPEASSRVDDIEKDIIENGYSIAENKKTEWKWWQMRETYSKENLNYGSKRANKIMSFFIPYAITRKFGLDPPIKVLILSSEGDTIRDFVEFCGPKNAMEYTKKEFKKTLRGKYGLGPEHSFVLKNIEGRECRFDFNGTHKPSTEEELEIDRNIYF